MENINRNPRQLDADVPEDKPQRSPRTDSLEPSTTVDIEHQPVKDDPRHWSSFKKKSTLFLVASSVVLSGIGQSIQNPAVEDMETDLPATSQQFSLSLSLFILVQGLVPLLWSSISELKGRKTVYLASLALLTVASVAVALSTNIRLVIAFRVFQAGGSSAMISIGAGTLADIFEPAERGTKMGIYYMALLLGSALGPFLGGVLTAGFGWRSIFWFLTVASGISFLAFLLFFRDTFRKERSLTYQNLLKQRFQSQRDTAHEYENKIVLPSTAAGLMSRAELHGRELEPAQGLHAAAVTVDPLEIKLTLKDLNPFTPLVAVVRRINNLAIYFASGLMYALTYMISYTSARTLSNAYHYDALMIGVILLSYGVGCMTGSVLGGLWSDYKLAQLKAANGGKSYPEMRLKSATFGLMFLPLSIIGYGWVCDRHIHIAALCVLLFASGFFTIWMYASMLAYLVDANNGRSAIASATNSTFRGLFSFVATEIAVPMQDNIGDGWLYTVWGCMMAVSGALTLLVMWKGEVWRQSAEERSSRVDPK